MKYSKLGSEWHKIKSTDKTRVTIICGDCEAEWDADKLPGTADCPWCGSEGGEGDHIVRVNKARREHDPL